MADLAVTLTLADVLIVLALCIIVVFVMGLRG
jgi:hypothetical protein